jgi:benzoyl-CoA 2,3-dioxygenase component B
VTWTTRAFSGAFNEPTPDWLAFYMFTFFTDRDGKFQLSSLAESGFDPLAARCRFMLTEEAHHMFVGETGVGRIIQRTAEVMAEHKLEHPDQVRSLGVIDLQTIQRYLNFHYSVTLDLFGGDVSSNAAGYYTTGLKGRYEETRVPDDHVLTDATYKVGAVSGGRIVVEEVAALTALNERLRRRLHRRGSGRCGSVEQGHREDWRQLSSRAAAQRLPPRDWKFRRPAHQPRTARC